LHLTIKRAIHYPGRVSWSSCSSNSLMQTESIDSFNVQSGSETLYDCSAALSRRAYLICWIHVIADYLTRISQQYESRSSRPAVSWLVMYSTASSTVVCCNIIKFNSSVMWRYHLISDLFISIINTIKYWLNTRSEQRSNETSDMNRFWSPTSFSSCNWKLGDQCCMLSSMMSCIYM
jgi:hypothetical protein